MRLNTDLETWLQDKFAEMGVALGRTAPLSGLRIAPPLAEWEANCFLRALDENLFRVNERGEVESPLLRGDEADGDSRPYRIFSAEPPRLLRENVCQLATASRLIIERGWLPRHVFLEPGRARHHSHADNFDLLVRSPEGKIYIWVEIRRATDELDKLLTEDFSLADLSGGLMSKSDLMGRSGRGSCSSRRSCRWSRRCGFTVRRRSWSDARKCAAGSASSPAPTS